MRRVSVRIALLFATGAFVSLAQAEDAFLSLRAQASVDGSVVVLGDVAEVTAREATVAGRLRSVELSQSFVPARAQRLTRSDIDALLVRQGAMPPGGVAWGGASAVTIAGRPRRLDLGPGVDAAAAMLMQELGGGYAVVLTVVDSGGEVLVPPGRTRIRPEPGAAYRLGAIVEVPLLVEVEGTLVARPTVRFEVRRSPLELAQEAGSATYRRAADDAPSPVVDITTHRRSGATVSGQVRSVADDLLVEKDHAVRFVIDAGSVRLEGEGIALADARRGDLVKVRRASGGTEIQGRVASPGLVMVEER